jgi:hypothetical protein
MSRIGTGDTIVVKPTNNVYTVLVVVATVAATLALLVLYMRAQTLFPPTGSGGSGGLFPT